MIAVLDVGGSSIKAGVADGSDTTGEVTRTPIDHRAPADELLAGFVAAATSVPVTDRLAVAIPEPFDYAGGISLMTHKFAALRGWALGDELAARLSHHPVVRCCNDAEAAVVGEAVAGAGAGFGRVLGLTLGTGLGAAFVVDGRPVPVAGGVRAGDLYLTRLPDGRVADDVVSARAYVTDVVDGDRSPDEFGATLAAVIGPAAAALGAEIVVLGGGGLASFDEFAPALRAGLDVPVVRAHLGVRAPIVGGARVCFG